MERTKERFDYIARGEGHRRILEHKLLIGKETHDKLMGIPA
jgi:hypothetical protein